MSKKRMPLWHETYFDLKMYKTHYARTIFGGLEIVPRDRRKGLWTLLKVSRTWGFYNIFNYTYYSNTLDYTTTTTTLHYILLHYTTFNYT